MKLRTMIGAALVAASAVTLSNMPSAGAEHAPRVRVPHCAEDEGYLEGRGDFDGARWDRYVCAHPDDIVRTEELHAALEERLCSSARARRHFARAHGISIMPESCDRY